MTTDHDACVERAEIALSDWLKGQKTPKGKPWPVYPEDLDAMARAALAAADTTGDGLDELLDKYVHSGSTVSFEREVVTWHVSVDDPESYGSGIGPTEALRNAVAAANSDRAGETNT